MDDEQLRALTAQSGAEQRASALQETAGMAATHFTVLRNAGMDEELAGELTRMFYERHLNKYFGVKSGSGFGNLLFGSGGMWDD